MILDTNVISELTLPSPDKNVMQFLGNLRPEDTFISCVTVHELWSGCLRLPIGARRDGLITRTKRMIEENFSGRVLDYDLAAAWICGDIIAANLRRGHTPKLADAQIAAIAMSHNFTLLTRNVKDFQHKGLTVINPWAD